MNNPTTNEPQRYVHKPLEITAIRFSGTEESASEVIKWVVQNRDPGVFAIGYSANKFIHTWQGEKILNYRVKLDGLKVQCVNPELGALRGKLERVSLYYPFSAAAWWKDDSDRAYIEAFNQAWRGKDGWALWVEGEIPLRRKTADQLEVGTYFLGKAWGDDPYLAYVGRPLEIDTVKTIYYAPGMLKAITPASEWVVLEEYGPFQKPEGK